jgi:Zn-dependent protease
MPFLHPIFIISILMAISIHEASHAFMARRLGDPTAAALGRLTLNPLAHLDLLGALMFITVGFGWAKPVPVNPLHFAHPKRDTALVALAGPLSNLVLAFVAFALDALLFQSALTRFRSEMLAGNGAVLQMFLEQLLRSSVYVNVGLMAFNLLPIAPLDGSKIIQPWIPWEWQSQYEKFLQQGPIFLLLILVFEPLLPFPILSWWVSGIADAVLQMFSMIFG